MFAVSISRRRQSRLGFYLLIIEDAKTAAKDIDSMFRDYYGEKLFEKIPKNIVEMYDLSLALCDEMKEIVRNDVG